jgi:hypothetical protein
LSGLRAICAIKKFKNLIFQAIQGVGGTSQPHFLAYSFIVNDRDGTLQRRKLADIYLMVKSRD